MEQLDELHEGVSQTLSTSGARNYRTAEAGNRYANRELGGGRPSCGLATTKSIFRK
jgi:hypothetical protein